MPRASVFSSIIHHCVVLVFASLFPQYLSFNFCCGCDFIWFRLFINSVLSLFTFFARTLFVDKLELVICNLGV